MKKEHRQIVKIVKEICNKNKIEYRGFSDDWIMQLRTDSKTMFIYGYKFPNNNAAIEHICNDKAAMSDILEEQKIPHVGHTFFMAPDVDVPHRSDAGDWKKMMALLSQYGIIVCKTNSGSGGRNVFKVSNQKELEDAAYKIFSHSKALAISPYKEIQAEYRVIIVNSSVGVIYEKKRPFVVGDGCSTIKELIAQNAIVLSEIELDPTLDISNVLKNGEYREISWKHNLGQGAKPQIVSDPVMREKLSALALSCVQSLGLEFASIDIVKDEDGLEILEINSGVMMENLSMDSADNYKIAKEIYEKAILHYMGLDNIELKYSIQRPVKRHFVLPVLEDIARDESVKIIPDQEEGNFAIFSFANGKHFVAKDYPFNINYAGSIGLCTNKSACACFLREMGYTVPNQRYFVRKADINTTLFEVKRSLESPMDLLGFEFPMIIKPNSRSQGEGVYKITGIEEGVLAARSIMRMKEKLFLIQEYCSGRDYRIVVLDSHVIQAYERVPFQIVGDGVRSVKELLDSAVSRFKADERDKEVDVNDKRIAKNISNQGYTMQSILKKGEICKLQDIANLSLGGTTRNNLDRVAPYYKNLAIKIAKDLNLKLCGIDLIAEDITNIENTDYAILEVNSAPGLDNYLYNGKKQEQYVKELYRQVFKYIENL